MLVALGNLTGKSSNVPFNGLNIKVTTYSDGSTRTCKIMKKAHLELI